LENIRLKIIVISARVITHINFKNIDKVFIERMSAITVAAYHSPIE